MGPNGSESTSRSWFLGALLQAAFVFKAELRPQQAAVEQGQPRRGHQHDQRGGDEDPGRIAGVGHVGEGLAGALYIDSATVAELAAKMTALFCNSRLAIKAVTSISTLGR